MDLIRTLPRIDRARFLITVCTFLERGELSSVLEANGIEIIGPFAARPRRFRGLFRLMDRQLARLLKWAKAESSDGIVLRLLKRAGMMLAAVLHIVYLPLRAIAYLSQIVRLARPIAKHIRLSESHWCIPYCPFHISSEHARTRWRHAGR